MERMGTSFGSGSKELRRVCQITSRTGIGILTGPI
jgi:hypothetical protein